MATAAEPASGGFTLSMLIYDRRYRSITIQVAALIGVVAALVWLGRNTMVNLAAADKDFDFGFLGNRAGFDINQRPIEYSSDSTYGRAAMVGLANTLLVAFFGCILATIIGVLVGVLRLSKNWLTARLMAVYVDALRNVPAVIWIFALFGALTLSTPQPRDFKGDTPTAAMLLNDSIAITNRGVYVPLPVAGAPLWGALAVLAVSVGAALFLRARSIQQLKQSGIEPIAGWKLLLLAFAPVILLFWVMAGWVYLISALVWVGLLALVAAGAWVGFGLLGRALGGQTLLAMLVQLAGAAGVVLAWLFVVAPALFSALGLNPAFVSFVPIDYPVLKGFNFQGGFNLPNSFTALWIALSLYTGAFIAENVRAGVVAISKGQTEAAYALGLRPGRTMSLVILPQALRIIIPPLISQYLNLTKNTSLGIAASYMDLSKVVGGITLNQTGRAVESVLIMMAIYLTLSLMISAAMNAYNRKIKLKER